MQVRVMRVLMDQGLVPVPMTMGLASWVARAMPVLMMNVMAVPVLVLDWLMRVFMGVRLREVEVQAQPHEQRGANQRQRERIAQ